MFLKKIQSFRNPFQSLSEPYNLKCSLFIHIQFSQSRFQTSVQRPQSSLKNFKIFKKPYKFLQNTSLSQIILFYNKQNKKPFRQVQATNAKQRFSHNE